MPVSNCSGLANGAALLMLLLLFPEMKKLRVRAPEVQHFDERRIAFRCLAGDDEQVSRMNRAMHDQLKRRGAKGAHHLQGDVQNCSHRHGPVRCHPRFRRNAIEIFRHVDEIFSVKCEIVELGNVDVINLLRGDCIGFDLLRVSASSERVGTNSTATSRPDSISCPLHVTPVACRRSSTGMPAASSST